MNIAKLALKFKETFHTEGFRTFFAPGRINLIGEHTDYNGGNVFPCAITYGTYALAKKRDDQLVRMYSMNFEKVGVIEFSMDELEYNQKHDWANYPKGMVRYLLESGYAISSGFDVLFYGSIPNGAGLSSSASIEMVTGVMLEDIFNLPIPRVELVKIGQRVENEFIGVNSGIMDQFAIGMGKKETGILLDCQTLNFEYAPIQLDHHKIIIMNTNKRRELADSKYNERRKECEEALKQLQSTLKIQALGQLTEQQFEQNKHLIQSETVVKRAKHAVYENARTLKALEKLKKGDLKGFGKLMNESHSSLRNDYEVSGKELDCLVESAWKQEGVMGARMTGAGFGGCAIAIVDKESVADFIDNVGLLYKKEIGYDAEFYIASIGDGAREIHSEVIV